VTITCGVEVHGPAEIIERDDSVGVAIFDTGTLARAVCSPDGGWSEKNGANSVVRERIGRPMADLGFFCD
jgi:hypothetical protein